MLHAHVVILWIILRCWWCVYIIYMLYVHVSPNGQYVGLGRSDVHSSDFPRGEELFKPRKHLWIYELRSTTRLLAVSIGQRKEIESVLEFCWSSPTTELFVRRRTGSSDAVFTNWPTEASIGRPVMSMSVCVARGRYPSERLRPAHVICVRPSASQLVYSDGASELDRWQMVDQIRSRRARVQTVLDSAESGRTQLSICTDLASVSSSNLPYHHVVCTVRGFCVELLRTVLYCIGVLPRLPSVPLLARDPFIDSYKAVPLWNEWSGAFSCLCEWNWLSDSESDWLLWSQPRTGFHTAGIETRADRWCCWSPTGRPWKTNGARR
jgi:hypothetical protein